MPKLHLPTIQNWSCHSCGNCCRDLAVAVTDDERARICGLAWAATDDVPTGDAAFARHNGDRILAKRADGACVFLDAQNRCKIHAKFGAAAKPLACRVYPFVFTPAGDGGVAVGLRFDCPTAAGDEGKPLDAQRRDLQALANEVTRSWPRDVDPPAVGGSQRLDWPDTQRIVAVLDEMLEPDDAGTPLGLRLLRARFVMKMVAQAKFDKIRGERVSELMQVLAQAAPDEVPRSLADVPPPDRTAKLQLRSIVAHLARKDTLTGATGLRYRLRMLMAGVAMARGKGKAPAMQPSLPAVPFEAIDRVTSTLTDELDEALTRYLRVKLQSLAFAGRAFYGMSLAEGFSYLSLMVAALTYLSRWSAAGAARDHVTPDDLRAALLAADAHYGHAPVLGQSHFRARVRSLESTGGLDALLAAMTR